MDDIRNTSALFVGGQDTAPHTERTARELWQLLFQKTENEMAGYMNRLDQLSRDELIQAADEISAMMTCHSELMAFGENLSRKKMIFLLQQEKPLELLSEAWMEHQTVDVGETFQSLLTGLYDETRQTQVRDMVYAIQPKTIEELLTSYPDDYFQLMTVRFCGSDSFRNGEALTRRSDYGTSRSQRMSDAGRGAGTSGDGGAVLKKRRAWLLVCTDRPPTAENGAGSAGAADVMIGGALHEHGSL